MFAAGLNGFAKNSKGTDGNGCRKSGFGKFAVPKSIGITAF
jgi:hypothetical protein